MSSNNNLFQTLTDITVTVQSHTYMTLITSKTLEIEDQWV